jgi:hypothetical protein
MYSGKLEEHRSGCRLPPGYSNLLDRVIEVLRGDLRVRAAWAHGSVARGDADEVPAFASGWRDRLDEITPTVMARPSWLGRHGSAVIRYHGELVGHHPHVPAVRPMGGTSVGRGSVTSS